MREEVPVCGAWVLVPLLGVYGSVRFWSVLVLHASWPSSTKEQRSAAQSIRIQRAQMCTASVAVSSQFTLHLQQGYHGLPCTCCNIPHMNLSSSPLTPARSTK